MTAVLNWDIVGGSDSDADLALAAASGDKRAFAGIYDRYADRLHDYCVGMLADRDGAADCVQDTFCIAATRLPQLRDPGKLRPWLYSIARNEALRRIRQRRRETPSEELPDAASGDPSPDTLAARAELADLIADAAGGLSDRDRAVFELAFRHGLNGPDLAEALGVTPTNANTIVHRLRDTIERSLGALLVSRRVRKTGGCPELAAILEGWDGHFNVLMRKRISRHIESCRACDEERQRLVTPVALLGAAPVFIPAPAWLREQTLNSIELTSAATPMDDAPMDDGAERAGARRNTRSSLGPVMAFVVALLAALASTIVWVDLQTATMQAPIEVGQTAPAPPAPPPPSVAPPPPTASVETAVPSAPAPPTQQTTAAPLPSAEPTPVVPPPVSEPPAPPPPAAPPPPELPPLPPLLPLPPLPEWPQWPGGDPGSPAPGSQFTGPSDIAGNPPDPAVP